MQVEPRSVLLVAAREFLENIRTKGFWISILLLPVILLAASVVPVLLTRTEDVARYAVIDASGWVADAVQTRVLQDDLVRLLDGLVAQEDEALSVPLADLRHVIVGVDHGQLAAETATMLMLLEHESASLSAPTTPAERLANFWMTEPDTALRFVADLSISRWRRTETVPFDRVALNHALAREELLGYFVIPEDPVASAVGAQYVTRTLTNPELRLWYERWVTDVIRDRRIREENIAPAVADWIQSPVRFAALQLTDEGAETEVGLEDTLAQWAPVAFVYLLWISIFAVTQMLLTNTVEEKSNKLVEVLLSSIAAVDLMAGKIVGIAATGLTIVATWLVIFIVMALALPHWLDAPMTVDLAKLVDNPLYLSSFVVYFLLGYLFYAALLCSLGSLASNLKEAQNLMMPVQLCLIVPLLVMIPIGRDPGGWLAVTLSWFPPLTPFVMMNRAAFPPGIATYLGTTLLLLVSIWLALRLAARIFETGILMSGKPPRIRQLLRLLRGPRHDRRR